MMSRYDYDEAKYGEFKCYYCGRKWYSSKAWEDFGQKCVKCNFEVKALKLWPLGRYNCYKCKRSWKTKYDKNGCLCDRCGEKVYPLPTEERNPFIKPKILRTMSELESVKIDPSKLHKRELCEKCKYYGKDCNQVLKAEMRARPKPTKIYNNSLFGPLANIKEPENPIATNSYNFNPGVDSVNLSYYSAHKNEKPIRSFADVVKKQQKASKSDNSITKSTVTSNANTRHRADGRKIGPEIQNELTYLAKSKTNCNYNNLKKSDEKTNDYSNGSNKVTSNSKSIRQTNDQSINHFTNREPIRRTALNSSSYLTEAAEWNEILNIFHPTYYSASYSTLIYTPTVREKKSKRKCVIL